MFYSAGSPTDTPWPTRNSSVLRSAYGNSHQRWPERIRLGAPLGHGLPSTLLNASPGGPAREEPANPWIWNRLIPGLPPATLRRCDVAMPTRQLGAGGSRVCRGRNGTTALRVVANRSGVPLLHHPRGLTATPRIRTYHKRSALATPTLLRCLRATAARFIGTDENRSDTDDIHDNTDEIHPSTDEIISESAARYFRQLSGTPSFLLTSVSVPVQMNYRNLYKSHFDYFL